MSVRDRSGVVPLEAATVAKVARLARISLGGPEQQRLATQMSEVLGYVKRLQEVDVAGVEPMAHPSDAVGVPRSDEPTPGLSREAALSNAPDSDGDSFIVPQILDAD